MTYKLPPLPDLLEKAITHFAQAVHYSDINGWIGAANNLRKEIKAYAIAAVEAQASVVQQEPCGRLEADEFDGHVFVPRIAGDWSMLNKDLYLHPAPQASVVQ